MPISRVAYRYAKPLFDLAQEKGQLEQVYEDMKLISNVCKENKILRVALKNPVIRGFKKRAVLQQLFAEKVQPFTLNLLMLMADKNRANVLFDISKAFAELYDIAQNIQQVLVTSATTLDEATLAALQTKLSNELGKRVVLTAKENPDLIGGLIVQIGNTQIDLSIKNSLQRLTYQFVQS
ncbi:ATP synthase F1 subunit delta [Eisenibacter elegans]|jgi:F-type H+-transporting ATPase subunit delta|uniref:ATP synthase F1 subunit delta n=1 Tax=Eisenibacter elegans TaxID=997 RepID=UPI000414899E|nr:ATP synthase F1 subunit delta [Eisenibacter elegans]